MEQARRQKKQVFGAWLPTVSLGAQQTLFSETTGLVSPDIFLRARQNIMSGLKEYSALRGGELEIKRRKLLLQMEGQNSLLTVANLYYELCRDQELLALREKSLKLTRERIDYLEGRRRLGKSTRSEVLSARAQVERLRAEKESLSSALKTGRARLEALLGTSLGERGLVLPAPAPEGETGNKSVDPAPPGADRFARERLDIRLSILEKKIAETELSAARGEYLPNIYLQGDYFLNRSTTFSVTGDYKVQVVAEFPLFSGLSTYHKVREKESGVRSAELALREKKRLAKSELEQARISLKATRREKQAYQLALDATRRHYEEVLREYRYRRVTDLEVLTSLLDLQEAEARLVSARYREQAYKIWLGVARNLTPAEILRP